MKIKMKYVGMLLILMSMLFVLGACGQDDAKVEESQDAVSADVETEEVEEEGDAESVDSLYAYVGAGLKEPFEDLKEMYEEQTGIEIEVNYNSSGAHVSQIMTAEEGDIMMPGGMPFIKKLDEEDMIDSVEGPIAYHVPVIVTPKDNPAGIKVFEDLTKDDVELIVPEIEGTALGKTFGEIMDNSGLRDEIEDQIIVQVETGPKVLATLMMDEGNAAITEYAGWNKKQDELDMIEIDPEINEVDDLPVAVLSVSEKKEAAEEFQKFIMEEGPAAFEKHGFKIEEPK